MLSLGVKQAASTTGGSFTWPKLRSNESVPASSSREPVGDVTGASIKGRAGIGKGLENPISVNIYPSLLQNVSRGTEHHL